MRHAFVKIALVSISIGVFEISISGETFFKVTSKPGSIFIVEDTFSVGSAELVDIALVRTFFTRLTAVTLRFLLTIASLTHVLDILYN